MGKTRIAWCDRVWNPTTGCTKVSQGCKNCYAERMAERFWEYRPFFEVRCHPERLDDPLHWRKPQRIFVDSMSDLFHPDVPLDFILRVWMTMASATNHNFIILTKRPERMRLFVDEWLPGAWGLATMSLQLLDKPLPNVWLGVSIENQATANERIPLLIQTPAAVRFVSYEPALGPVNFHFALCDYGDVDKPEQKYGRFCRQSGEINWIIQGCESGLGARPMELDWVRSVRDQCQAAGVPFFFKQAKIDGKLIHMPALDGQMWAQFPHPQGAPEGVEEKS
jgi:protein gp37